MNVPAKAYVCAYCKRRLRTSPALLGCLGLFGLFVLISVISGIIRTSAPPPTPQTAEERANAAEAEKAAQENAKAAEAAFLKTPAGKIWQKHQNWNRDVCETIAKKQIQIGMTAEQVRASWGRPSKVNSTITARGTHEQWVYDASDDYVYFDDGIMTSVQQSK